ncbi:hypothetical protein ACFYN3_41260 [Streptomyces lavendulae]
MGEYDDRPATVASRVCRATTVNKTRRLTAPSSAWCNEIAAAA